MISCNQKIKEGDGTTIFNLLVYLPKLDKKNITDRVISFCQHYEREGWNIRLYDQIKLDDSYRYRYKSICHEKCCCGYSKDHRSHCDIRLVEKKSSEFSIRIGLHPPEYTTLFDLPEYMTLFDLAIYKTNNYPFYKEKECCVCYQEDPKWYFESCRHQCLCNLCKSKIVDSEDGFCCPMCQQKSTSILCNSTIEECHLK